MRLIATDQVVASPRWAPSHFLSNIPSTLKSVPISVRGLGGSVDRCVGVGCGGDTTYQKLYQNLFFGNLPLLINWEACGASSRWRNSAGATKKQKLKMSSYWNRLNPLDLRLLPEKWLRGYLSQVGFRLSKFNYRTLPSSSCDQLSFNGFNSHLHLILSYLRQ